MNYDRKAERKVFWGLFRPTFRFFEKNEKKKSLVTNASQKFQNWVSGMGGGLSYHK